MYWAHNWGNGKDGKAAPKKVQEAECTQEPTKECRVTVARVGTQMVNVREGEKNP